MICLLSSVRAALSAFATWFATRKEIGLSIGLALMTAVTFGHTLLNDFVNFDDPLYVTGNLSVLEGISIDSICWDFTVCVSNHWHPLTWLSLQMDVEMFGYEPIGFHFTNLLLHTCNVLLLFRLLTRMTAQTWRSAAVAACFAVHPLHVESVAWVTERKDVLSTLFFMLTLLAYDLYVRRLEFLTYLLVVLLFAVGLLAKPMLMTLPGVMLLLDFWPLRRLNCQVARNVKQRSLAILILEKLPLTAVAIASGQMSVWARQHGGGLKSGENLGLNDRIGYSLLSATGYLKKMLWPSDLAVFYPLRPDGVPFSEGALSATVLIVMTLGVLSLIRSRPYLSVGLFWYLGTLFPVCGMIQLGSYTMADRYTYIPLIGIFILLVWGLCDLCESPARLRLLGGAAAVVLAAWMTISWKQVCHWQNSITLWEHALAATDDNFLARTNLATAFSALDRPHEARIQFEHALRFRPNLDVARYNLGSAFHAEGNVDEAIRWYEKALAIRPDSQRYQHLLQTARKQQVENSAKSPHSSK